MPGLFTYTMPAGYWSACRRTRCTWACVRRRERRSRPAAHRLSCRRCARPSRGSRWPGGRHGERILPRPMGGHRSFRDLGV